jgi:hypothetical protein
VVGCGLAAVAIAVVYRLRASLNPLVNRKPAG